MKCIVRSELNQKVSVHVHNQTLADLLATLLKNTDLTYRLNDRQVMILKKTGKDREDRKSVV